MIRPLLSAALLAAIALPVAAQRADFTWNKAVAAGGTVSINNINGDIKVVPSTSGRVEVTGIKRGSGADRLKVDVQESSRGVTICVLYEDSDSYCDDRGSHSNSRRNDHNWERGSISLQVSVPANLAVQPNTVSGDIDVSGAQGDVKANTVSGDIILDKLRASSVQANTVSGNVKVHVDDFTGRGDLSFNSVSGDITLELPRDFAADLSMSTVSGEVNTDFALTMGNGRMSSRSMSARIGGGGRRLEVATVSGDLKLRMNGR